MSKAEEVIDAFLEISKAAEKESRAFRGVVDLICDAVLYRDPIALKGVTATIEEGGYSALFGGRRNPAWEKWQIDSFAVVAKLNTLTTVAVVQKSLQEALLADSMRSLVVSLVQLRRYGWNTAKVLFNDRLQAAAEKLEAVKSTDLGWAAEETPRSMGERVQAGVRN